MQPVFQLTPNPPNSAPRVPRLQWWETVCQVQGIDFKNHWWCHRVSQKRGSRGAREPCSSLTYDSLRVSAESLHGPRDSPDGAGREGKKRWVGGRTETWTQKSWDQIICTLSWEATAPQKLKVFIMYSWTGVWSYCTQLDQGGRVHGVRLNQEAIPIWVRAVFLWRGAAFRE